VGPEHSYLKDSGRAEYVSVTDDEALEAFELLSRVEGIIPALESAHAIAHIARIAPEMDREEVIVAGLSGRGDKDVEQVDGLLARNEREGTGRSDSAGQAGQARNGERAGGAE